MSEQVVISKVNADAVAGGVLVKLILFSVSLGLVPIGSYFLSLKYLWHENSTFAAITAVVAANVVLVAYIISSVLEDRKSTALTPSKEQVETKKNK